MRNGTRKHEIISCVIFVYFHLFFSITFIQPNITIMLRTTTTAAVRAFKPVQVSAIPRRAYSEDAFKKKETAEEAKYFRQKVNSKSIILIVVLIVITTHRFDCQSSPGISILKKHVFLSYSSFSLPILLYDLSLPITSDSFLCPLVLRPFSLRIPPPLHPVGIITT